ncbi:STAS domain-containing protein [Streptomyces sp. 7R007]
MGIQDTQAAPGQRPDQPMPDKLPLPGRHARSRRVGGIIVVELCGIIDLSTIPELQAHTDAATDRHGARVVVDLRRVEFLDCSTLGLLCRTRRRVLERGGRLAVVCVRPWHLRILKATGLRAVFAPVATLRDALEDG